MLPDTSVSRPTSPARDAVLQQALECRGVTVEYDGNAVLKALDLAVPPGETVALLGPSGSGKTTLLHAVAGILPLAAGKILIDGVVVASANSSVPPEKRRASMVFQNYALWPHLNALDNVAYPLRRAGLRRKAARAAALTLLDRLGIAELADRRPAQLSGGQQQRVGVARALARHGEITLFDEPTAHLDAMYRAQVQVEIGQAVRSSGAAVLYATHDPAEAMSIADRIALLRDGRLLQIGTPYEIYETPCDLWAARLTGPASVVCGHIDAGHVVVDTTSHSRGQQRLLVRPEWTSLGGEHKGCVHDFHYRGSHTDYTLDTAAGQVVVRESGRPTLQIGATTSWSIGRAVPLETHADDESTAGRNENPGARNEPREFTRAKP